MLCDIHLKRSCFVWRPGKDRRAFWSDLKLKEAAVYDPFCSPSNNLTGYVFCSVAQRLLSQTSIASPIPPPLLHSTPALCRLLSIRLEAQLHEILLICPLVRVPKDELPPHAHDLAHFLGADAVGFGERVGRIAGRMEVVWRGERRQ